MTNYQFLIVTYKALDGACIVKARKLVNVKRMHLGSARDFIHNKYKERDGFFVELHFATNLI